jgi:tellurite resistance protein
VNANIAWKTDMATGFKLPIIPASFFGIVLGIAGLGNAWRVASRIWALPTVIGETISLIGVIVWFVLLALFALKWIVTRPAAIEELAHPVLCCFIGLAGVSTMLAAGAVLPYWRSLAVLLFGAGAVFTLAFAVWRTGNLWQGNRPSEATTAVLYLPLGAGSFVTAITASALGYPDWGQLFLGAGILSSLAIESVLLHRLYTSAPMAPALRPTLGIQLAPPAVAAVAYLSVYPGPPDVVAHVLVGYGLLQALLMIRLLPWILEGGFTIGFWAFTFGATALASASLRLLERGGTGPMMVIAPVLFVGANLVVGLVAIRTIILFVTGGVPLTWWSGGDKATPAK